MRAMNDRRPDTKVADIVGECESRGLLVEKCRAGAII